MNFLLTDDCNDEENSRRLTLSELLDSCGGDTLSAEDFLGDEETDPDVLSDPLYQVDVKSYLMEYFSQFCRNPLFRDIFVANLNDVELGILKKCRLA